MTSSDQKSLGTAAAGAMVASDHAVRIALARSYDRLRNYLHRRFGAEAEAEEVLQAFVLRALERSGDIRNASSVRGWLSRVLATTIADFHRKSSKDETREAALRHELNDHLAADPNADPDSAICECFYVHLASLRNEHAEVIRRVDLAGESRELVAAELGVTVNNLTVRLFRARQALRERLEQTCVVCLEDSFWECRCSEVRNRSSP